VCVCVCVCVSGRWVLRGLLALNDRVRAESPALITAFHERGIRVIMITGDRPSVAKHVLKTVGLEGQILAMTRVELEFATPEDRQKFWIDKLKDDSLCCVAGVLPEDKHAIVVALQLAGHVVGMTGDGANDSPALKQAEVGVAVHKSVDLAKLSSSAVMLVRETCALLSSLFFDQVIRVCRRLIRYHHYSQWFALLTLCSFERRLFFSG
jgi:H+-transporting ATPase